MLEASLISESDIRKWRAEEVLALGAPHPSARGSLRRIAQRRFYLPTDDDNNNSLEKNGTAALVELEVPVFVNDQVLDRVSNVLASQFQLPDEPSELSSVWSDEKPVDFTGGDFTTPSLGDCLDLDTSIFDTFINMSEKPAKALARSSPAPNHEATATTPSTLPKPPTLAPAAKRQKKDTETAGASMEDLIRRVEGRIEARLDKLQESVLAGQTKQGADILGAVSGLDTRVASFVNDMATYQGQVAESLKSQMGKVLSEIEALKGTRTRLPPALAAPLLDLARQTLACLEEAD